MLPSAMTWIVASLHAAFGFALIGAVVGEVLAPRRAGPADHRRRTTSTRGVYAGIIIIAVLALMAEFLITRFEKRVLRWRPSELSGDGAGL